LPLKTFATAHWEIQDRKNTKTTQNANLTQRFGLRIHTKRMRRKKN